jgi:hypothetical protein
MKRFLLFLLLITGLTAQSQTYNNEWIDYSKTYYKFKVGATGLYRISQPVLAGLGIGNTPAQDFQLWRKGEQVPLYTTVQTGTLGAGDYIEFWGEMNDGKSDNELYRDADYQLNNKWSLETDTVFYFLTINPSGANRRLVPAANILPSVLPVEPYFLHTEGIYYKNRLNNGYAAVVGEYVYSSSYDPGEGWASPDIGTNVTRTENLANLYPYTGAGAPAPVLRINASGNALNPRQVEVRVNNTLVNTQTMDFFDYKKFETTLAASLISGGTASIAVKNATAISNDRMAIAQTELVYPRLFNFGGGSNFIFELEANTAGNYLEIVNFTHGGVSPVIYDLTNGKRYVTDITNPNLIKVALEPSAVKRKLVMFGQYPNYPIFQVTSLQTRNFINYLAPANQGNFLIISHPAMFTSTSGSNPVDDYRIYRSSAAGGGHIAKIYLIDDLVDQFGLGVKKNPAAIRNFILWSRSRFTAPVKNVLLIGKGINYTQYRTNESNPDVERLSFIPSFGFPASDNLLACDSRGDGIPKVSIGRLSTITGDEVAAYLSKLKQYEQYQAISSPLIADKAWMKNVVHVIGAADGSLGAILTADMERYRAIVADTFYGANVNTFSKVSSAPVEQASSDRLSKLFEQGIGVMTYFGHSSATTLEFNLDNPDQYNNPGKYPITIVMGCNAGNFFNFNTLRFLTKETLSEKFVLADQRGSIAFIASTHFGIVHYLDIMNTKTMTAASVTHYGKTLGEVMRESIAQVYNLTTQNDYYARFHTEQATLHGDPAIRFDGSTDKPDYAIEEPLVKVNPSFISVAETHFKVDAKFVNLGKAISKNIVVEVKRTYPNLTTEVIRRDTIPGIRFMDSLSYSIDIVGTRDKGLNRISICVDADNAVDELYETNNCVSKDVFIYEDEARPVYPYNYAIINNPSVKLVASTANPFGNLKQYVMEMDTTELFNSSVKISRTLSSAGGVMEFIPGITLRDSVVYHWRVAPVPVSGQPSWNKSSFIYLSNGGPNSSELGYNQSDFYQHTKSSYVRVSLDTASHTNKFGTVYQNLFLRMGTYVTSGSSQASAFSVAINGVANIRLTAWFQSLVFNVFDPVSFRPWQNRVIRPATNFPNDLGDGRFGSHSPMNLSGVLTPYNFEYRYTTSVLRKRMMDFMKDSIPDGFYVVVRNFTLDPNTFGGAPNFPIAYAADWAADESLYGTGNSLYHYLKNAGLSGIDSFYRPRPFGIVYKKNDPAFTPKWIMGAGVVDNPTLSVDCPTIDTVGFITSPVFGPSMAWKQLKWRGSAEATGDTTTLNVIGITPDGDEHILITGLTPLQQDVDISTIDAEAYPFVKLQLRTSDNVNFTPYNLRYWRVTYQPVPEGAIAPNLYLSVKDTVEVGEPYGFKVGFKNVSEAPFDSIRVKMVITDKNNVPHIIPLPRTRPLPVNDTLQLGAVVATGTIPGANTVYVEANPDNDQWEQYHFNNFAFRNLYVKPDSLNPLLDVTFDGMHILNRDIVSSKPDIVIKLKDEAKWMSLDDTTLLTLQVRYPNGSLRRFYFNNDTLQFNSAGQVPVNDNTATLNFKPYFAQDGEYEMILTGKDKSDNEAGAIEYRVMFEVINKPMISNMLNYPNPFTSSTAFVFTITGNEVPQNIKIEIMTVTGKIVREITKDELGPLRIGRNITEFKWDGTDQYGQKLANGIYLYRVVTNLNGKALDKYKAQGDDTNKYFNKGYGKMYLMR